MKLPTRVLNAICDSQYELELKHALGLPTTLDEFVHVALTDSDLLVRRMPNLDPESVKQFIAWIQFNDLGNLEQVREDNWFRRR